MALGKDDYDFIVAGVADGSIRRDATNITDLTGIRDSALSYDQSGGFGTVYTTTSNKIVTGLPPLDVAGMTEAYNNIVPSNISTVDSNNTTVYNNSKLHESILWGYAGNYVGGSRPFGDVYTISDRETMIDYDFAIACVRNTTLANKEYSGADWSMLKTGQPPTPQVVADSVFKIVEETIEGGLSTNIDVLYIAYTSKISEVYAFFDEINERVDEWLTLLGGEPREAELISEVATYGTNVNNHLLEISSAQTAYIGLATTVDQLTTQAWNAYSDGVTIRKYIENIASSNNTPSSGVSEPTYRDMNVPLGIVEESARLFLGYNMPASSTYTEKLTGVPIGNSTK